MPETTNSIERRSGPLLACLFLSRGGTTGHDGWFEENGEREKTNKEREGWFRGILFLRAK